MDKKKKKKQTAVKVQRNTLSLSLFPQFFFCHLLTIPPPPTSPQFLTPISTEFCSNQLNQTKLKTLILHKKEGKKNTQINQ